MSIWENLSLIYQKTSILRKLLSNKVEWTWEKQGPEQKCFDQLKETISNAPILKFFDPGKSCTLSVDASKSGIGAVLLQNGNPIAYSSISLTPTQQRYNHIEKELLAIVYGCEHFHYYLFGQDFQVQTDHKPLLAVIQKPLEQLSPRLQRLVLKLMRYRFHLELFLVKNFKLLIV